MAITKIKPEQKSLDKNSRLNKSDIAVLFNGKVIYFNGRPIIYVLRTAGIRKSWIGGG